MVILADSFIVSPKNIEVTNLPDHGLLKGLPPGEGVEPSAAVDGEKSNWKSTASTAAKLLLCRVRGSTNAFGPLKSVAGGLCFILESCEVWSTLVMRYSQVSRAPQRMEANKQAIELLTPRV